MRDVAAEAGVSFKTVSRVVNDEGGVSEALVRRVQQAVVDLGYRPDQRARNLRQAAAPATTIGFVLVDVANPFFSKTLRSIEQVAIDHGCLVLAGSTGGSQDREEQLIEALVDRRVAGLIVVSSGVAGSTLKAELNRHTPVVFLDLAPDLDQVDLVRSDHRASAIVATEHLLHHGHRDIAYFGDDPSIFSGRLRLEGFLAAMAEAGLTVDDSRVRAGTHTEEEWAAIIGDSFAIEPRPTAIFTAQNFVTIGAVRALNQLDLRASVAQVGFDDVELADVVSPGITVILQQPRELGRRAAELLFSRLEGDSGPPRTHIVSSPLIERGSGEIRARTS